MNASSPSPFSPPETAPDLARRFCAILAGLAGLVARRFVRMPHLVGITVLLWGRLARAVPRLARALDGAAKPRTRRPRMARAARARGRDLPAGRGWLLRELGWEAAAYTSQMEALLAEPRTQAMLLTCPGLGRILRPICRMLGVAPGLVAKAVAAADTVVAVAAPVGWPLAARPTAPDADPPKMRTNFLPA